MSAGGPVALRAFRDVPALLTPAEVGRLFRVDTKTVGRWAAAGRISATRTPGGQRRFSRDEVLALLDGLTVAGGGEPA